MTIVLPEGNTKLPVTAAAGRVPVIPVTVAPSKLYDTGGPVTLVGAMYGKSAVKPASPGVANQIVYLASMVVHVLGFG